jgi:hypothetical protein
VTGVLVWGFMYVKLLMEWAAVAQATAAAPAANDDWWLYQAGRTAVSTVRGWCWF